MVRLLDQLQLVRNLSDIDREQVSLSQYFLGWGQSTNVQVKSELELTSGR